MGDLHRLPRDSMTTKSNGHTGSGRPEADPVPAESDDVRLQAEPDLRGDWSNLSLLLLLYVMQGLTLGIASSIPILIQSNKDVTYNDQTIFSFSGYPYTLKIIWAPIVDVIYMKKFGRRKSWVVPIQYLIGIVLIYAAWDIDNLLPRNGRPDVISLLCVFFSTSFLVATQFTVVDGWSLSMLKKNNVGYASVCNSVGQAIGRVFGSMPPVLLTSEKFCNDYLRATPILGIGGIVSMKTLLYVWGVTYLMISTLIAVLKKENDRIADDDRLKVNVLQSYSLLWYIVKLPSIQLLSIILVTMQIGFIPAHSDIVSLKLIDAGISKDTITIINSLLIILNILTPIAIAKLVSGPKAMDVFLQTTIFRLPMNVVCALLIYYTSQLAIVDETVQIPTHYYAILVVTFVMRSVISNTMFVALQSFFFQISDARFGGTYMTLLYTVNSFGTKGTYTAALELLHQMMPQPNGSEDVNCRTTDLQNACNENRGAFSIPVDGYYVETLVCTVVGVTWYFMAGKKLKSLRHASQSNWLVDVKTTCTRMENADNETRKT